MRDETLIKDCCWFRAQLMSLAFKPRPKTEAERQKIADMHLSVKGEEVGPPLWSEEETRYRNFLKWHVNHGFEYP